MKFVVIPGQFHLDLTGEFRNTGPFDPESGNIFIGRDHITVAGIVSEPLSHILICKADFRQHPDQQMKQFQQYFHPSFSLMPSVIKPKEIKFFHNLSDSVGSQSNPETLIDSL